MLIQLVVLQISQLIDGQNLVEEVTDGKVKIEIFPSEQPGDDIMFAINIPQEAVVIPETIDGIRASLEMQKDRMEAVGMTNQYLGMK